ncbi:hypothetical protein BDN72DRAFT_904802 [Pluteus cervinus]|uniref:Uncharacterized protein n=1 Tax=Pluteus cervinus TaxID=181527 RepID=A0ACD3A4W5_9AGAR|nr:hypothetical protein BDN72DRAFT_904802 [Pluteus cervinus]
MRAYNVLPPDDDILDRVHLVLANRIINIDLSWNYASEPQGCQNWYRLAEAAFGEGTGARLHKLSVKDIKYLFGIKKPEPLNVELRGGGEQGFNANDTNAGPSTH